MIEGTGSYSLVACPFYYQGYFIMAPLLKGAIHNPVAPKRPGKKYPHFAVSTKICVVLLVSVFN